MQPYRSPHPGQQLLLAVAVAYATFSARTPCSCRFFSSSKKNAACKDHSSLAACFHPRTLVRGQCCPFHLVQRNHLCLCTANAKACASASMSCGKSCISCCIRARHVSKGTRMLSHHTLFKWTCIHLKGKEMQLLSVNRAIFFVALHACVLSRV